MESLNPPQKIKQILSNLSRKIKICVFFLIHTEYSWKLIIYKFTIEISTHFNGSLSYRLCSLTTIKFN